MKSINEQVSNLIGNYGHLLELEGIYFFHEDGIYSVGRIEDVKKWSNKWGISINRQLSNQEESLTWAKRMGFIFSDSQNKYRVTGIDFLQFENFQLRNLILVPEKIEYKRGRYRYICHKNEIMTTGRMTELRLTELIDTIVFDNESIQGYKNLYKSTFKPLA